MTEQNARTTQSPSEATPTSSPSSYITPVRYYGDLAFVSGQLPRADGELTCRGQIGTTVGIEEARQAARLCASATLDLLDRDLPVHREVAAVLKLTGFIACSPDFQGQPGIIDAASEVLIDRFGDAGRHARSAVGVAALPHGASVEIEIVVALQDRRP